MTGCDRRVSATVSGLTAGDPTIVGLRANVLKDTALKGTALKGSGRTVGRKGRRSANRSRSRRRP